MLRDPLGHSGSLPERWFSHWLVLMQACLIAPRTKVALVSHDAQRISTQPRQPARESVPRSGPTRRGLASAAELDA